MVLRTARFLCVTYTDIGINETPGMSSIEVKNSLTLHSIVHFTV